MYPVCKKVTRKNIKIYSKDKKDGTSETGIITRTRKD